MAADSEPGPGKRIGAARLAASGFATAAGAVALVAAAAVLWYTAEALLVVFSGILLAVFLYTLSCWFARASSLSEGWSLAAVVSLLVLLAAGGVWLLAPEVAGQASMLAESLPRSWDSLQGRVRQQEWGRPLLNALRSSGMLPQWSRLLSNAGGIFSQTLGVLADAVIIIFIGIYLAADPRRYAEGLIRLFPAARRPNARRIFEAIAEALKWQLIGRLSLMVLNAIVTTIGLWLLGIPLALTLGILSGLLNFIPNFGPVLAAVPAVLLALMQSPTQALYVLVFYVVYQALDGYVLTPLVQRRMIQIPAALTIAAQVLFGILLGGFGLLLAVPITAVLFVLVKKGYIEGVLHENAASPPDGD